MKNLFTSEIKRLFLSPKRLLMTLGLPLLIFGFFGYLFREDTPKDLPVVVTDYDQSAMSRKLIRFLDATTIMQVSQQVGSPTEASTLLKKADAYAYIVIPKNFEKDILQSKTTKAICYTNGNYLVPSSFIQSGFVSTVGTFSAGINLNKRTKKNTPQGKALAEVQAVKVDNHGLYNPYKNYNYFLNLALIPMLFQMVVMTMSIFALGQMFKYRETQRFLKQAGGSYWRLLLGKLLPYTLMFLFLGLIMNIYLFKIIDIPYKGNGWTMALVVFSLIIVNQAVAVFFVSMLRDLRSALAYGGALAGVAFSFSGYTFPIESMPESIQYLTRVFPFTHFLQNYIHIGVKGLPISYNWGNVLAFVFFISLALAAYPRFVQLIKNNGYEKQ